MTARKHPPLAAVFAAFTSEELALAYARLVEAGGVPKDEAAAFAGRSVRSQQHPEGHMVVQ